MADSQRYYHVLFSFPAQRDLAAIMQWSANKFGEAASVRYETLILQAVKDLSINPYRPGSSGRPDIMVDDARVYSISYSRPRVSGTRVKSPRHLILYKLDMLRTIVIARILHDSRDLKKHLPASYKRLQS